jgi:hypothetical protein
VLFLFGLIVMLVSFFSSESSSQILIVLSLMGLIIAVCLGLYPIVILEKQLLNMIGNLV